MLVKEVRISLGGRERTMKLNSNALCLIEEASGKNILQGEYIPNTASAIRIFLWATLVHEDPLLTPEKVGSLVQPNQFAELVTIIARMMNPESDDPAILAPFVPTPEVWVRKCLQAVDLKPGETLMDLGCGDGRVLKLAATEFNASALGFETNDGRFQKCRDLAAELSTEVRQVVVFKENVLELTPERLGPANVVFLYLLTQSNTRLKPLLAGLLPGARVVSHDFPMVGWVPYQTLEEELDGRVHRAFAYRIGEHLGETAPEA